MRYLLLIITCCMLLPSIAQNKKNYTKQILLVNDNDVYMLQHNDGYYTNGLFVSYSMASFLNNKQKITNFEFGQKMYTAGNRKAIANNSEKIDRPFCGLLYAKYEQNTSTINNNLITYHALVGVTGKWSLAEQVQNSYHNIININAYPYWEKQIPNAVGINIGGMYAATIAATCLTKIVSTIEGNLGNLYTNAKIGTYICIGAFEKNNQSVLFNTAINSTSTPTKRNYELFFYFNPQITAQAYNATVQGALLYSTKDAFVTKPNTFLYSQTFGIGVCKARLIGKAELIYATKETSTQLRNERYGSIHLGYRFN